MNPSWVLLGGLRRELLRRRLFEAELLRCYQYSRSQIGHARTCSNSLRHVHMGMSMGPFQQSSLRLLEYSHQVELILKNWHQIEPELGRWRDMLLVPWNRYRQLHTPGVT